MVLLRRRYAGAASLWLCALALVGVGAVYALRTTDHGGPEGVLAALHELAEDPRVAVRSLDSTAPDEDLKVAALRLALRWEERGYAVALPGLVAERGEQAAERSAPARYEVLLGELLPGEGQPGAFGLSVQDDAWVTADGRSWPRASSVVGITLTQDQLRFALPRLGSLGLRAPVASEAKLVTLLLHSRLRGTQNTPWLGYALKALSLGPPSCAPRVVLWSEGGRVVEIDLDEDGYATELIRPYPAASAADSLKQPSGTGASTKLVASALRASAAIRSLGGNSAPAVPLTVAHLSDLGPYARDGALQRSGWYDMALQQLVVLPGSTASADDAVEDFLETELLRRLGRPGSAWFLRGLIYGFTGRAGGFFLKDLESISQSVTFEEALANRRTRLALAGAKARLMRAVLAEFNADLEAAYSVRFDEDEEMLQRLRAQWSKGLEIAPVVSAKPRTRRWSGGAIVEVTTSARGFGQLGSDELHRDFRRIAALGFTGVQLAVHVPVPPLTSAADRKTLILNPAWGHSVTLEGDGALQWSAAKARAQGLSVTLAPRFVMSAGAGPGHTQVHGGPEQIRLYGDRRAVAMEGAAWLAEQIQAEALVIFEPTDLPDEVPRGNAEFHAQLAAAKTSLREQSALFAGPFVGERIAFCRTAAAMTEALKVGMGETALGLQVPVSSKAKPQAPLLEVQEAIQTNGGAALALRFPNFGPRRKEREDLLWSALPAPPRAVLMGGWRLTSRRQPASRRQERGGVRMLSGPNLREFTGERLRGLAAMFD